jgi:hypothetical protein
MEEKNLSNATEWKSWWYAVVSGRRTTEMDISVNAESVINNQN